ncbi:protein pxr-1-like [Cryptomeria japonica]|uniref:protein pxr-1-like n=1 Tax=Cryptomeria japonica TaxID=3369 RepID=UPI0027DA0403|nr:protein pxr-1-like [Cryptomeria japonica]
MNSVPTAAVHAAYMMIKENAKWYASTLLDSPLDPKKKRTGTYLERIKHIEVPKQKNNKVVPSALTLVTSAASPKVTKRSPEKKKPEVIPAKEFERKRKTRNNSPDLEGTELEVEMKKTSQSSKKTKSTGNVQTTSAPVKAYVKMQQVSKANRQDEQEPDSSTAKPDEVFDSMGDGILEQNDPIDVDALDIEDITSEKDEKAEKEKREKEKADKEKKEKELAEKARQGTVCTVTQKLSDGTNKL